MELNHYKILYIDFTPNKKRFCHTHTTAKTPEEAIHKILHLQLEGKNITVINVIELEDHAGCCLEHNHTANITHKLPGRKENDQVSTTKKNSVLRGRS